MVARLPGAKIGPVEGGGVDARRQKRLAAQAARQQESVEKD